MLDLFFQYPWLLVIALGALVPITAIVFSNVTSYLEKAKRLELDAALKHEMLERGMSAQDIEAVLAASSKPKKGFRDFCPEELASHVLPTGRRER
ncbi:MAG: hypothetical protein ACRD36_01325 [Candidatus Acidiferrum sp.]